MEDAAVVTLSLLALASIGALLGLLLERYRRAQTRSAIREFGIHAQRPLPAELAALSLKFAQPRSGTKCGGASKSRLN